MALCKGRTLIEHERFVEVEPGLRLFTRELGSGPAVMLCDGLGCDGYIWQSLRHTLARTHRVIHWHYRGHGQSDPPRGHYGVDVSTMVSDMSAILDEFEVAECALIGHSMGVQIILQAALESPKRFWAIVPICGSYGRPLDTFHGTDIMLQLLPWLLEASERFGRAAQHLWSWVNDKPLAWEFARHREMNPCAIDIESIRPYFEHLSKMDLRVFLHTLSLLRDHTVKDRLDEIVVPTLIIAGARDSFTPVWLSRQMARWIPAAELLVVEAGTHIAPLEVPEIVEPRVVEFLGRTAVVERRA